LSFSFLDLDFSWEIQMPVRAEDFFAKGRRFSMHCVDVAIESNEGFCDFGFILWLELRF
jgi:hypothetical protein